MVAPEDFQVWKRVVDNNAGATLICEDGNDHVVTAENIPHADFPAPGVELWFRGNVIYLPNAH